MHCGLLVHLNIENEQNFDVFPRVVPGITGKGELAKLVGTSAIDGNRPGCDTGDHTCGVAYGCYRQFGPSCDL